MREAWGKSVCVTGLVGREMASGRPVSVTEVQAVRAISNTPPGAYKHARGILGQRAEKPEMTIRRLRDMPEAIHRIYWDIGPPTPNQLLLSFS